MDVINLISKRDYNDAKITDPSQEFQDFSEHCVNGPRIRTSSLLALFLLTADVDLFDPSQTSS